MTKTKENLLMTRPDDSLVRLCLRKIPVACAVFVGGALLIVYIDDHNTPTKESFYSWLLVFINAYIGILIANRATKQGASGFFAWIFLGHGLRAVIFLILLLGIVKWQIINVRGFVLTALYGYFVFLAAEILSLNSYTPGQTQQKDE